MIGKRKVFPWSRRRGGSRGSTSGLLGGAYRRPIAVWLAACCVLVVLLGLQQFAWIDHVDDAQRAARVASLEGALTQVIAQLHEQMLLLLTSFDPGADFDHSRRLKLYLQRYKSWHQTSAYGPLVERILFLDFRARIDTALTELVGESGTIQRVQWGKDMAPVQRHINKEGLRLGRVLRIRGGVTWMLYPRPLAVYRPIAGPKGNPGDTDSQGASVTGYLILQLDLDFIRDRLVPKLLNDHLGNLPAGARYTVTIAVDGKDLLFYEPSDRIGGELPGGASEVAGYSPQPLLSPSQGKPARSPDRVYPLLLSSASIPRLAKRLGAVQQIALRSPVDILRSIGTSGAPPGRAMDFGLDEMETAGLFDSRLTESIGFPRLFLKSNRPHQITIHTGHAGVTLEEGMNSEYMRSVAMGVLALVLLVGSMAMVAASGISAARRAEMSVEALASQSHQLRTPVAAITVLADNLASGKLQPGDQVIEHAGLIRDYGEQLTKIVDSTEQVVATKSSKRRSARTMVDVSKVAQKALEQAGPLIRDAGITTECSFAEDLPPVLADAGALRQSTGELLSNAVKYGQPGQWLRVETCEAGSGPKREVRIRVLDRGQGIPRQEARKIFQPYYRTRDVASSLVRGSGLGLTLVRSTVEEMGGELTLEHGEGGGSVFTIHLPIPR